jgi:hypothetical protein
VWGLGVCVGGGGGAGCFNLWSSTLLWQSKINQFQDSQFPKYSGIDYSGISYSGIGYSGIG